MLVIRMRYKNTTSTIKVSFVAAFQIWNVGPVVDGNRVKAGHIMINIHRAISPTQEVNFKAIINSLHGVKDNLLNCGRVSSGDPDANICLSLLRNNIRRNAGCQSTNLINT